MVIVINLYYLNRYRSEQSLSRITSEITNPSHLWIKLLAENSPITKSLSTKDKKTPKSDTSINRSEVGGVMSLYSDEDMDLTKQSGFDSRRGHFTSNIAPKEHDVVPFQTGNLPFKAKWLPCRTLPLVLRIVHFTHRTYVCVSSDFQNVQRIFSYSPLPG